MKMVYYKEGDLLIDGVCRHVPKGVHFVFSCAATMTNAVFVSNPKAFGEFRG